MNTTLAAADIARRIPEMAKDSTVNNEAVIQNILNQYIPKGELMRDEDGNVVAIVYDRD